MNTAKDKYDPLETTMSLGDHLEELRARLILALAGLFAGMIICLLPPIGKRIIAFIQMPYEHVRTHYEQLGPLIFLAPADAFIGYMKISLIAGLILTSPWVFYQLWMFIASGLYPRERQYVRKTVPFSTILFVMGSLFFLFVVAPISLTFFVKFGDLIKLTPIWTFRDYVSFMTILMLVFGLAFQTPIAIFILNGTGLVSIISLKASRKYVLLSIFVIAAMVTPPDVISQITLALPLYLLYELGIHISLVFNRKKNQECNT